MQFAVIRLQTSDLHNCNPSLARKKTGHINVFFHDRNFPLRQYVAPHYSLPKPFIGVPATVHFVVLASVFQERRTRNPASRAKLANTRLRLVSVRRERKRLKVSCAFVGRRQSVSYRGGGRGGALQHTVVTGTQTRTATRIRHYDPQCINTVGAANCL